MRYKIQPSEHVDHITENGQELTRLPYPIIVNQEGFGRIGHKERSTWWASPTLEVID